MKHIDGVGEQEESTAFQANTLFLNSTGSAWEKPISNSWWMILTRKKTVQILRRTKCPAPMFWEETAPIFHFEETFVLRCTVLGFSKLKQDMKCFIQDAFCPFWYFSLTGKLIKPIIYRVLMSTETGGPCCHSK